MLGTFQSLSRSGPSSLNQETQRLGQALFWASDSDRGLGQASFWTRFRACPSLARDGQGRK
jgi:hypothetical protein